MIYNIFDTEADAKAACEIDSQKFFNSLPTSKTIQDDEGNDIIIEIDNTAYESSTTCWACPMQRLDGKWVYPKYPESDQVLTEETYDSSWFPSE